MLAPLLLVGKTLAREEDSAFPLGVQTSCRTGLAKDQANQASVVISTW